MSLKEFSTESGAAIADQAAAEKHCSACDNTLPVANFAANASNADGLQRHCRSCMRDMKARTAANKAKAGSSDETFAMLPLDLVVPSRTNPRTVFDAARLQELAESIRASGVHQPILVRVLPGDRLADTTDRQRGKPRPTHEIVCGERRYRASVLAGVSTIPAMIRSLTDADVLEIQIVENLQRDDLTELEEAEGYQRLCAETSVAKEDIGAKIGKSRSYVYGRMKLLDLCGLGREAMRAGSIDASKALLIARIPDEKLQIKALDYATETDYQGAPRNSHRALQTWLQTNVMLKLQAARFDIKSESLCPDAGACPSCPKRTGADLDLFADVDSPDICTDPACYHDKEKTHDEIQIAEAEKAGRRVIKGEQAEKLLEYNRIKGYTRLDSPEYSLGVSSTTVRKALGKHCPEPTLFLHPTSGEVIEVLPTDRVKQLVKEKGLGDDAKNVKRAEEKRAALPIEQRHDYSTAWSESVVDQTDAWIKSNVTEVPVELLRSLMVDRFDDYDEGPFGIALDLGDEFDTAEARAKLIATPAADLAKVFVRYMLHEHVNGYQAFGAAAQAAMSPRTPIFELAHMAGVDVAQAQLSARERLESEDRAKAMEAEAKAKVKAGARAKAPAGGPLAAPQEGSAKGAKKSSKKPAAPAPKRKTTIAEAEQGIAAALQALPAGPGGAAEVPAHLHPQAAWPFPKEARP